MPVTAVNTAPRQRDQVTGMLCGRTCQILTIFSPRQPSSVALMRLVLEKRALHLLAPSEVIQMSSPPRPVRRADVTALRTKRYKPILFSEVFSAADGRIDRVEAGRPQDSISCGFGGGSAIKWSWAGSGSPAGPRGGPVPGGLQGRG